MTDLEIITQLEKELGIQFETGKADLLYFQTKGKYGYYGLDENKNVTRIVLYKLEMNTINSLFFELRQCETFTALRCEIEHIPNEISNLSKLKFLNLGYNRLTELPRSLVNCNALENLILLGNQFKSLPEFILSLPELKLLSLESNQIAEYPIVLNSANNNMRINLIRNQITELPLSVLQSKLALKRYLSFRPGIFLAGNNLVSPPLKILKFSRGSLPLYFKLKENNVKLNALHIVALQIAGFFLRFRKSN